MQTVFIILHVIVSLLLVGVVLMQSSKGGGLAGAFGGGGGLPQQMFGAKAMTTVLHKITIYLAVAFFLTSGIIFVLTADRSARSVRDDALDGGGIVAEQPVSTESAPVETTTDEGAQ